MTEPLIRTHGLGGARQRVEIARRRIEREDVDFANANKHRMGWQTMAAIRGVNMVDLRRVCEHGAAVKPAAEVDKPKAAPEQPLRKAPPPIDPVRALKAVRRGAAGLEDLADLLCCTKRGARGAVEDLRARGWLAGHAGSLTGWIVTDAGEAALRGGRS